MIPHCPKCNKRFFYEDFDYDKKLFHCKECGLYHHGWNMLADDWYNKTYPDVDFTEFRNRGLQ